jgi:Bromodomain
MNSELFSDNPACEPLLAELQDLRGLELFLTKQHPLQPAQCHATGKRKRVCDYQSLADDVAAEQQARLARYWDDVRKEIKKLMKTSMVQLWFGVPVKEGTWCQADPKNWESYCNLIKEPMDLRTVQEQLGDSGMPLRYKDPYEVCRHVRLIVENAETFNSNDSGDQVRKAARTLSNTWERRWQPNDGTGLEQRWLQHSERVEAENTVCQLDCSNCLCLQA